MARANTYHNNTASRLSHDLEILNQLNLSRQDNILHSRLILARLLDRYYASSNTRNSLHQQQAISNISKYAFNEFTNKIEDQRTALESKIVDKYSKVHINSDGAIKNVMFGTLLSRASKIIKTYQAKLQIIFPKLADHINQETLDFLNELRQFSLQRLSANKTSTVSEFCSEFQKLVANRFRKEVGRLNQKASSYIKVLEKKGISSVCTIDNSLNGELSITYLKHEKYYQLTRRGMVQLSVQHHLNNLRKKNNSHQTSQAVHLQENLQSSQRVCVLENLADYLQLQDQLYTNPTSHQNINSSLARDECMSFCDTVFNKFDKFYKDLLNKNAEIQKEISHWVSSHKAKESKDRTSNYYLHLNSANTITVPSSSNSEVGGVSNTTIILDTSTSRPQNTSIRTKHPLTNENNSSNPIRKFRANRSVTIRSATSQTVSRTTLATQSGNLNSQNINSSSHCPSLTSIQNCNTSIINSKIVNSQNNVLRQTLMQVNIEGPNQNRQRSHHHYHHYQHHSTLCSKNTTDGLNSQFANKLTEFPSSLKFYKDKLSKTQFLVLFRKKLPAVLKENFS